MEVTQETSTQSQESVNTQDVAPEAAVETTAAAEQPQSLRRSIEDKLAGLDKKVAPQAPAYTPNYKFKALDKEFEFDEWLRPHIKSSDQEKKLRELYEKAYGLDHVKSERDKIRTDYKSVNEEYTILNKGLDNLNTMLTNKDFHGFFNALKIPEQDILQYALSRVQYSQLPPEQRQMLDQQYQEKQKLAYYEQANQELIAAYQNQMGQQRSYELDSYLNRPEVTSVASAFDARAGYAGAFKDEVIRRGQYYASLPNPQDIPVEQAVREIMSLVGTPSPQAAAMQEQQNMMAGQQSMPQQQTKPVIPNIKGRGTSPAKKVVRSISDLRKLSASAEE